ncbi:hypothetical protein QUB80_26440 [Chlorogloeopsis sp. ULAP01]|uniref:hypothetical protein n=1 Tax=Chlorogloeopsis sp. ULAP01 TaxID=3056483 RepID=UPI0025AAE8CE|nr:hypothetical protein [Chlorogloeopsis sp. ULAP01]MDM9384220.1 hypothetical protein [Chlorogloeopsis sp. ULAP01]
MIKTLYQFSVRLHFILTPPNLPLPREGAAGGGVISMCLHIEMVLQQASFYPVPVKSSLLYLIVTKEKRLLS